MKLETIRIEQDGEVSEIDVIYTDDGTIYSSVIDRFGQV